MAHKSYTKQRQPIGAWSMLIWKDCILFTVWILFFPDLTWFKPYGQPTGHMMSNDVGPTSMWRHEFASTPVRHFDVICPLGTYRSRTPQPTRLSKQQRAHGFFPRRSREHFGLLSMRKVFSLFLLKINQSLSLTSLSCETAVWCHLCTVFWLLSSAISDIAAARQCTCSYKSSLSRSI